MHDVMSNTTSFSPNHLIIIVSEGVKGLVEYIEEALRCHFTFRVVLFLEGWERSPLGLAPV